MDYNVLWASYSVGIVHRDGRFGCHFSPLHLTPPSIALVSFSPHFYIDVYP